MSFKAAQSGACGGPCLANVLAGSSAPVLSAMMQPLEAGPSAITVALVLFAGHSVAPGTAQLSGTARRRNGGAVRVLDLALQADPVAGSNLPLGAGSIAPAFRIVAADVVKMRALQRQVAGWKAACSGSGWAVVAFGCGLRGCCCVGLYRHSGRGGLSASDRRGALRDLLGAEIFDTIAPCNGAQ